MNNLHRELAPISDPAWADLEAEARRTFTRHVAARRVADVIGPAGETLAAIGTGHLRTSDSTGVSGPYALLLSAEAYTLVAETTDHGYPVREHIKRVLGKESHIIWAPALSGALLLSTRGGDFELYLGQDLSIGYLSHDADSVELYFQESLTFLVRTSEAGVKLSTV